MNDSRVRGEEQRAGDPNSAGAREFARLLAERGVAVDGGSESGSADDLGDSTVEIAAIESAPLAEIIEEMLTTSDNNTAEMMVKEIGFASDPNASNTREAGLAVVQETLVDWGIDTAGIVLADGSGLSPTNRLTCAALVEVLQRSGPDGVVGSSLAVAAETGTLEDIFTEHSVAGRLLGKTGTLGNPPFDQDPPASRALAGYLPAAGGGVVEYVLILNGETIHDQREYRPIWDDLVDTIDTYPSGPSAADLGIAR